MRVPYRLKVEYQGVSLYLYSIGWIALYSRKGRSTLKRWEQRGVLPKPLLNLDGKNHRLYTSREILEYSTIIRSSNSVSGRKTDYDSLSQAFTMKRLKIIETSENNPSALSVALPGEDNVLQEFSMQRENTTRKAYEKEKS